MWQSETLAIQNDTKVQAHQTQQSSLPEIMKFAGGEPERTRSCQEKTFLGVHPGKLMGTSTGFDPLHAAEAALVMAHLFGDMEPLDDNSSAEALQVLANIHPAAFGAYRAWPNLFAEAWNRQRELFSLPGAPLAVEESVYKVWTSDQSHPLKGNRGLTRGEPAAHMEEVLRGFGVNLDVLGYHAADHLAVLLEFLAFLLESRPIEEARRFCRDHLDWLDDLKTAATDLCTGELVPATVEAAEYLVSTIVSS